MTIRSALSAELTAAMRRRDTAVVTALRNVLSATANAEAAPLGEPTANAEAAPRGEPTVTAEAAALGEPLDRPPLSRHFAGATPGLGATEVPRVDLTEERVRAIVAHERDELLAHAERLTRLCRREEADAARRAAGTLADVVAQEAPPGP